MTAPTAWGLGVKDIDPVGVRVRPAGLYLTDRYELDRVMTWEDHPGRGGGQLTLREDAPDAGTNAAAGQVSPRPRPGERTPAVMMHRSRHTATPLVPRCGSGKARTPDDRRRRRPMQGRIMARGRLPTLDHGE